MVLVPLMLQAGISNGILFLKTSALCALSPGSVASHSSSGILCHTRRDRPGTRDNTDFPALIYRKKGLDPILSSQTTPQGMVS